VENKTFGAMLVVLGLMCESDPEGQDLVCKTRQSGFESHPTLQP
jgi:hypothetical protein